MQYNKTIIEILNKLALYILCIILVPRFLRKFLRKFLYTELLVGAGIGGNKKTKNTVSVLETKLFSV